MACEPKTTQRGVQVAPLWTGCQALLCGTRLAQVLRALPNPSLFTQSSCISFSYWKETVSILLNPDRQSPSALVSYIEEPYMDIDRDFTEE